MGLLQIPRKLLKMQVLQVSSLRGGLHLESWRAERVSTLGFGATAGRAAALTTERSSRPGGERSVLRGESGHRLKVSAERAYLTGVSGDHK